jgi:hypothetical protein
MSAGTVLSGGAMTRVIMFGQKTRNSNALNKRPPNRPDIIIRFSRGFKGESSMTTVLPSPLPALGTPLAADSLPGIRKTQSPALAAWRQFPPVVSPRKEPPTSSGQIPRLQGEPTEPPKQTLNGRNQPLNGAATLLTVGQVPDLPYLGLFCISSLFALFPQGGNRQTAIL